jgi:hypothetical protein
MGEAPNDAITPRISTQETASLKAEITAVQEEIKTAEAENAKQTGGLVKSLVVARIAILQQTEAMLQQRLKADTYGIAIKYTVDGRNFVPPASASELLRDVEQELTGSLTKIKQQEAEAPRYSGGLTHAMSLSTLATMRQTEAMLEQKRVSLKYGLPQYIGFSAVGGNEPSSAVASTQLAEESRASPNQPAPPHELAKAIMFAVLEKGFIPADPDSGRYKALVTLKCAYQNVSPKDVRAFTGTLVFQDLFGREIFKVTITISDPVRAGQQAAWSGTVSYNQFVEAQQRFRAAELRDMKVVWAPASIIFSDGTKI